MNTAGWLPIIASHLLIVTVKSSDWIIDSSFAYGKPEIFYTWNGSIFEMQQDLLHEGYIIMTSNSQIISTNGATTFLVAGEGTWGYAEGAADKALFDGIMGLVQLDQSTLVVPELNNHCLRLVDRYRQQTAPFAGRCQNRGYANGAALTAQFGQPIAIIRSGLSLFVSDYDNEAIRMVNLETMLVSTVVRSLKQPGNLLVAQPGTLLVSRNRGFTKIMLSTGQTIDLNSATETGYKDGALYGALFNQPEGMKWIAKDIAVVADYQNSRLRLIDFQNNNVSTLCAVSVTDCTIGAPWSLLIINKTLFVGSSGVREILAYPLSGTGMDISTSSSIPGPSTEEKDPPCTLPRLLRMITNKKETTQN